MTVKGVEGRGMEGSRGLEESHQVGIASSEAIGRDLDDEQIDNGT